MPKFDPTDLFRCCMVKPEHSEPVSYLRRLVQRQQSKDSQKKLMQDRDKTAREGA